MKSKFLFLFLSSSLLITTQSCETAEEEVEVAQRPKVNLVKSKRDKFIHKIKVQGNVETDQDVMLSAEMGGLIISVDVKEGQKVSKGQVIAQVDASVLSSNLQELQTQLDYAEYMLKKQEELNKRGVGSEIDLESAKSQVEALKASIQSLSTQRGKATIIAPFTGIIDQVFAKKGQMAGPATPIARLVNNSTIDVVATISEKHFAHVHVGTPIEVTFPNYSDTVIHLKVTSVGNYIDPTNRTFRIKSTINNNTYFLPNMLAEISISDVEVEDGLVIPSQSVLKDQNNEDFVFTAVPYTDSTSDDGLFQAKRVNIEVIQRYEGECLIKENAKLKEGEWIVVEGARGIANHEIVRNK